MGYPTYVLTIYNDTHQLGLDYSVIDIIEHTVNYLQNSDKVSTSLLTPKLETSITFYKTLENYSTI